MQGEQSTPRDADVVESLSTIATKYLDVTNAKLSAVFPPVGVTASPPLT